jgi:hypothetical protein
MANHTERAAKFAAHLTGIKEKRELVSSATAKKLRKLNARAAEFDAQAESVNIYAAEKQIAALKATYAADPNEANFAALTNGVKSQQELERRNSLVRDQVHYARKHFLATEGAPVIVEALRQIVVGLDTERARIETQERQAADFVGVPFEASETLFALCARIKQLSDRAHYIESNPDSCSSPRDLLREFVNLKD